MPRYMGKETIYNGTSKAQEITGTRMELISNSKEPPLRAASHEVKGVNATYGPGVQAW